MRRVYLVLLVLLTAMLACGDPEDPRAKLRREDRTNCILEQTQVYGFSDDEAYDQCKSIMDIDLSFYETPIPKKGRTK